MDLPEFLAKCLDEDERCALGSYPGPWVTDLDDPVDENVTDERGQIVAWVRARPFTEATREHVARHDPARVLREVAAKRAILAEVASWQHDYVDGDSWLSCAQAVDEHDEERRPGSGCADETRRGGPCECGLERRCNAILYPLAQAYADRPGFKEEWKL